MSADNWGVCPKCAKKEIEKTKKLDQRIKAVYGKVPKEEFEKLIKQKTNSTTRQNLREDYDIRTDKNGIFSVGYYCSCNECGFEFSYSHEQNVA